MQQSYIPNKDNDKKFLVYTSSAGSGKTYTLSRFFIKLLLKTNDPNYFRHVAALTFTNKAANEMKERIFNNLYLLSLNSYENEKQKKEAQTLLKDYSAFLQISKEEIQEKSAKIVNEILHNYSDLTVQTIDKFTHKIIRPFARDLDISPDFSIELDEGDIIKKSVELMLQKSSGDEFLSKILLDFAYYKVDEGKRFQSFEEDLFKLADVFKKEDAIEFLKDYKHNTLLFFFQKKDEIKIKLEDVKQSIVKTAADAVKLIQSSNINLDDFFRAKSGVGIFFEKLSYGKISLEPNASVIKALEENVWYSKTSKKSVEIDAISPKLAEYLKSIFNELPNYHNYSFLYARIFPTALLNEIEKIIEEVKDSQNILTITDFNKLISNLIATSHLSVPFLYERIGERYNHYLLDEFQDTSVLQWNNMLPLIDESLSKGNENLLVGDAKQAIYRFRNGDVEQFVKLPHLPHKPNSNYDFFENTLVRNIQKETLKTNYRSYSNIIEFNNLLFSELAKKINEYQKEIYKDVAQEKTEKHGGYVNIEFYEGEDFSQEAKNFTLSSIKNALNAGFGLNEIAVLVRSRKEIPVLAEFLIKNNVEVVSEESLKLTHSEDVSKLIECLKFLINPNDSLQSIRLLMLLNPNLQANQLHELLEKKEVDKYIEDNYSINYSLLNFPLLYAIDKLALLLSLNVNSAYFNQFKSFVWDKFKKEGVSVSNFIRYWKTLEEKETIPSLKSSESIAAVQILTVHKSKGLQYPVVILPFVNWETDFYSAIKWIQPEGIDGLNHLATTINRKSLDNTAYSKISNAESEEAFLESMNVLYVAFTRAEEHLYALVDTKKGIGKFIYSNLESFINQNKIEKGNSERLSKTKVEESKKLIELKKSLREKNTELNIAPESYKYWKESKQIELDYGTFFHEVMKKITTIKDKQKVLDTLKADANLSETDLKKLTSDINLLLDNELMKEVFKNDNFVFNEKELFFENNIIRIDKLSLTKEGKVFLVDFKTGDESTSDLKQIKAYQDVLEKLNFKNVTSILYYTRFNKIVPI